MDTIFLEGTLELIASFLIVFLLVKYSKRYIQQHRNIFYLLSATISLASLILGILVFLDIIEVPLTLWWVRCIRSIVSGYLPAVIFIFVMYAGFLPNSSQYKQVLMVLRSELSIIGTILYLPHTFIYSVFSAPRGILMLLKGEIHVAYQLMTVTGLINAILLLILGFTSIPGVRKKLSSVTWKKIQSLSYLFYSNCFVHYMTLSIWSKAYERTIIYVFIYGIYLRFYMIRSRNRQSVQQYKQVNV